MVRDTVLVFRRYAGLSLRNPTWVLIGLIQPVLYLALFGPLVAGLDGVPGFPGGGSWQVFVPGMLVMLSLFSAGFVGFSIIAEWRNGVVERLRVTPLSRVSLLAGRLLRDLLIQLTQACALIAAGMAFGLRARLGGLLVALALVVLLTVAMASLSYAVGLRLKDEEAMAPLLNTVNLPMLLLSGILLPMSLAPGWLDALSRMVPFRYVVDGLRAAFAGQYGDSSVWIAVLVAAGFAALAVGAGTRVFVRENA